MHDFHQNPTLARFSTAELVRELKEREAVDSHTVEPHQQDSITVNGPAIVLVVSD